MNRREMLARCRRLALGWVGLRGWRSGGKPLRHILLFTKSSGCEHAVVKSGPNHPSLVERTLNNLGERHGFAVTSTKDGRAFARNQIARYDAFFFYTTGDLTQTGEDGNPPMSVEGKSALLAAIYDGKGFIGVHSATDTFPTPAGLMDGSSRPDSHGEKVDPYVAMIGGEIIRHGEEQTAHLIATEHKFPGMEKLGAGFDLVDEWYSLKHFASNLHVLLVLDTRGLRGHEYRRAPYPSTWARRHGKGRVFYSSMGHRKDVWTAPLFLDLLRGGIAWTIGDVDADVAPNLKQAAPGYAELPPLP